MDDERDERDDQQDPDDLGTDPDAPIIHTPPPRHPHHSSEVAHTSHHYIERSIKFVRSVWPSAVWVNATSGLVTAAATVIMVIVYIQIKGIMASQGAQTNQLITAANTQAGAATTNAEAAQRFSSSASQISQHTDDAVAKFQALAKATQSAADTARQALINSGRPWIGIPAAPVITDFTASINKDGHQEVHGKITFQIFNFGQSPALHLNKHVNADFLDYEFQSWASHEEVVRSGMKAACFFAESGTVDREVNGARSIPGVPNSTYMEKFTLKARGDTVFPNQMFTIPNFPINVIDGGDPARLKQRSLFLFGCLAYADRFGKTIHHTKYCFEVPAPIESFPNGGQPLFCGTNTDAD